jgi:hypothetical protein
MSKTCEIITGPDALKLESWSQEQPEQRTDSVPVASVHRKSYLAKYPEQVISQQSIEFDPPLEVPCSDSTSEIVKYHK